MRELKFRVWSEDQKTYDYKFPYNSIGDFYVNTRGKVFSDFGNTVAPEVRQEAFIVEQYTGLKDKNGKEIYEGDIVDYNDDGECIGVVEYDAPEFCLNADATNWARMFLKGAPHQRVIGNIHENPELVKEKE